MNIYEVVTKVVGPINPVGETHTDNRRFDNLEVMCDLVDRLLTDIDGVAQNKHRCEYSMKKAGVYASDFYTQIGIEE